MLTCSWPVQQGQCSHNKALLATPPPPIAPFLPLAGWLALSPLPSRASSSSSQMRLPRFPIFSLFTANLGLILLSLPCLSSSHGLSLDKALPGRSEGGNSCDLTLLSRLPASGPSHSPRSQSLGNAKKDQLGSFISGMKWSHRA